MVNYGQYIVPPYREMVNFGVGQPSTQLLPLDLIKEAMKENLNITDPSLLQYGDIPGYYEFRKSLSDYLENKYGEKVDPNNLFTTNGVTQALTLISSLFTKTGDVVFVEEPTYFLAINIFKDFKLNIESIPMENDGINLDLFLEKLEKYKDNERVMLYTIPCFHNPTSITMPEEKRLKLASICNKYNNLLVIADEVYQLLYFDDSAKPPKPLCYYHSNIISLGSFSKILAPSLRLGWMQASDNILNVIKSSGQLDSSGGLNPFVSSIVHTIIDNGSLEKHLISTRKILKSRCDILYSKIIELLNNKVIVRKPAGGYFLWLKLNDIDNTSQMLKSSDRFNVKFHPGNKCSNINSQLNCLRISFSYYSTEGMEVGANRLSDMISFYTKKNIDNKIKVAVHGSSGKLGNLIINEINKDKDMVYFGPIDRNYNIENNIDIIVDVSSEEGTLNLIKNLEEKKIPLIVGTTGNIPVKELKLYSRFAPVAVISNFSDGIPYLIDCLKIANDKLKKWDINITEKHHKEKKDSPSGTAKTLRKCLTNKSNILIDSIREGNIYGEHIISMNNESELVEISHRAKNREIFAIGAIKYIKWLVKTQPGYYNRIINDEIKDKNISFIKYSGCGNDFIIIDNKNISNNINIPDFVKKYSKRGTSIGADGVIFIDMDYETYDAKWTYYNSDGSLALMCGNGARCVARYVYDQTNKEKIKMITSNGIVSDALINNDKSILTSISEATFKDVRNDLRNLIENMLDEDLMKSNSIDNIYRIDILVPHLVIIIKNKETLDSIYVNKYGKIINDLLEDNVNINFISLDERSIRTYERGVNSETLACGTGCCAMGFVINKLLQEDNIKIKVRSGDNITIKFIENIIHLEGNANKIYNGEIEI